MAKTLAEKIAVMQAAERGEKIEVRHLDGKLWTKALQPNFNWEELDYRVAPRTMEVMVVSWKEEPEKHFPMLRCVYDNHYAPERLTLHAKATLTY